MNNSIILVPGLGTVPPESWPFADKSWLLELHDTGGDAGVFAYQYTAQFPSNKTPWETIMLQGFNFLEHLASIRVEEGSDMVSTLDITVPTSGAHSLDL